MLKQHLAPQAEKCYDCEGLTDCLFISAVNAGEMRNFKNWLFSHLLALLKVFVTVKVHSPAGDVCQVVRHPVLACFNMVLL